MTGNIYKLTYEGRTGYLKILSVETEMVFQPMRRIVFMGEHFFPYGNHTYGLLAEEIPKFLSVAELIQL